MVTIPDKKRNAPLRTLRLSGRSHVIDQFILYQCKGMSGTAASREFGTRRQNCIKEIGHEPSGGHHSVIGDLSLVVPQECLSTDEMRFIRKLTCT